MARRMYHSKLLPDGCHMQLVEVGNARIPSPPDPPTPMPSVLRGPGGLLVSTRCPDYGNVDLEVWAGDPGLSEREVVFEGELVTAARGFDAGPATAITFHVDAPPGKYQVRADVQRDADGEVDSVRFIFLQAPDLEGRIVNP